MQKKLVEHWGFKAATSLPGVKDISAGFERPKHATGGPEATLESHPHTKVWFTEEKGTPIARVTYAPQESSHKGRFIIQVNLDGTTSSASGKVGRKTNSTFGNYNEVNGPTHVKHFRQIADLLEKVHTALVAHAPKPKREDEADTG